MDGESVVNWTVGPVKDGCGSILWTLGPEADTGVEWSPAQGGRIRSPGVKYGSPGSPTTHMHVHS
jgi:hypothetical protein